MDTVSEYLAPRGVRMIILSAVCPPGGLMGCSLYSDINPSKTQLYAAHY